MGAKWRRRLGGIGRTVLEGAGLLVRVVLTPLDQGKRIAHLTPARSLAGLPGVGHIPHIEDPKAFTWALEPFARNSRREEPK